MKYTFVSKSRKPVEMVWKWESLNIQMDKEFSYQWGNRMKEIVYLQKLYYTYRMN